MIIELWFCVFAAKFSSEDFFKLNPEVPVDDYTMGSRVAFIDGKVLPADDYSPYMFFDNVEGVRPGPVEKADVYDLGNRCIAYIENDSLEFEFYDEGNRFKFADAHSSFNAYLKNMNQFFFWIGDINRNGHIDFIMEIFGSQAGNSVHFIEKQNDNGRAVLKELMAHSIYSAD